MTGCMAWGALGLLPAPWWVGLGPRRLTAGPRSPGAGASPLVGEAKSWACWWTGLGPHAACCLVPGLVLTGSWVGKPLALMG